MIARIRLTPNPLHLQSFFDKINQHANVFPDFTRLKCLGDLTKLHMFKSAFFN